MSTAIFFWFLFQGALSGGLVGIIVSIWIAVGAKVHNIKTPPLPSAGIEGCFANMTNFTSNTASLFHNQSAFYNATSIINQETFSDNE